MTREVKCECTSISARVHFNSLSRPLSSSQFESGPDSESASCRMSGGPMVTAVGT